jgi:hypothetical protein
VNATLTSQQLDVESRVALDRNVLLDLRPIAAAASPMCDQKDDPRQKICRSSLTGLELEHGIATGDVRRYQLTQILWIDTRVQQAVSNERDQHSRGADRDRGYGLATSASENHRQKGIRQVQGV